MRLPYCPAAKSIKNHLVYVQNRELFIERAKKWSKENAGRRKEIEAQWRAANKDKTKIRVSRWKKLNADRHAMQQRTRVCRKLHATPKWLTPEQWEEIYAVYTEAARLTRETGVQHEVDHIHPLQGKTVCGLHVPWNLRVITQSENCRKGNRLVDRPTGWLNGGPQSSLG